MDILILGGFLGSGKTSIIRLLIRGLVNAGKTCAIIENEIGEVGIDDALIDEAGLSVTPLFGGCVCCQISGSLLAAIDQIKEEIAPDWVIIEMTGLAMMDSIKDLFDKYSQPDITTHTVSLVDMSRWKYLLTALSIVFDRQIAGADIVLLNKTDIMPPTDEVLQIIADKAPGALIRSLDDADKQPDQLWQLLMQCIAEHDERR